MVEWVLSHPEHGAHPWDVQREALLRSAGTKKYAYWLEQGLGKTSLTLNSFMISDAEVLIILAPNSFKGDWAVAPEEWGIGDKVTASIWPKIDVEWKDRSKRLLWVFNHESARGPEKQDGPAFEQISVMCDKFKVFLVIDEASVLGNPTSTTSKKILELCKRAYMVRLLDGTPMTQNVMNYYIQLRCVGLIEGMNPYVFKKRFCETGGFMGKQITGSRNEEELARILNTRAFRALKTDWRDLPPKIYHTVKLEMSARQRRHYSEMMEEFFTVIGGVDVSAELVLTRMEKLRQISSCIAMSDGDEVVIPGLNPKLEAVKDILQGSGSKAIVVYNYRMTGKLLHQELKDYKPASIVGTMDPQALLREKHRFNTDPNCRVLIGQQRASCMGHTLIGVDGDRVDRMIFMENSFTLRYRLQMEDRIHRGAQDIPCNYYDLVTSPMDQITVDALKAKKDKADMMDALIAQVRKQHERHSP